MAERRPWREPMHVGPAPLEPGQPCAGSTGPCGRRRPPGPRHDRAARRRRCSVHPRPGTCRTFYTLLSIFLSSWAGGPVWAQKFEPALWRAPGAALDGTGRFRCYASTSGDWLRREHWRARSPWPASRRPTPVPHPPIPPRTTSRPRPTRPIRRRRTTRRRTKTLRRSARRRRRARRSAPMTRARRPIPARRPTDPTPPHHPPTDPTRRHRRTPPLGTLAPLPTPVLRRVTATVSAASRRQPPRPALLPELRNREPREQQIPAPRERQIPAHLLTEAPTTAPAIRQGPTRPARRRRLRRVAGQLRLRAVRPLPERRQAHLLTRERPAAHRRASRLRETRGPAERRPARARRRRASQRPRRPVNQGPRHRPILRPAPETDRPRTARSAGPMISVLRPTMGVPAPTTRRSGLPTKLRAPSLPRRAHLRLLGTVPTPPPRRRRSAGASPTTRRSGPAVGRGEATASPVLTSPLPSATSATAQRPP